MKPLPIAIVRLDLPTSSRGNWTWPLISFVNARLTMTFLSLLYSLSLDFERKRQFNKAQSALEYIATYNAEFRDVKEKNQTQ